MQAIERPRFKQELVAEPIEENGSRYIDLMDPDSGNVFRFYEVEYALACGMDGERDVAGIVRWAQEELGLSPSAKEIQTVISTLGDLGYLDVRPGAETAAPPPVVETAAPPKPAQKPQPKADEDLAHGIVVGAKAKAPAIPVEDFELGASGGGAPQVLREDLVSAPDIALGASGTSAAPKRPDPISAPDIALGASGAGEAPAKAAAAKNADLSMDLSEGFALRQDDVKEAVRASKVMSAVDVPKDLMDQLEAKPAAPPPKAEPKKPEPKVEPKVEAKKPEPKVADKVVEKPVEKAAADKKPEKPADKAAAAEKKAPDKKAPDKKDTKPAEKKPADKKAVELPKHVDKKAEDKKPIAPPAPKPGISPVLIVLLVLAVLGGGAFLVWKYVLDKPATDTTSEEAPPPVKKPPPPPAPPPPPSAKLGLDTPATIELKFRAAGTLEWIDADKDVNGSDVVAKLAGHAALEGLLAPMKKDLEKPVAEFAAAQTEMQQAQASGDAAKAKAATDKFEAARKVLEPKQKLYTTKEAELEKLLVRAPANGKFTAVAKANAKVTDADVIGSIAPTPKLKATLKVPHTKLVAGGSAKLGVGGSDKTVTCPVSEVQGESVTVTCDDPAVSDGTEVVLK